MAIVLRRKLSISVLTLLCLGAGPAVAAAAQSPALIKGEEAGYFGSATVTRTVSVFVYSKLGPAAGNRITVCLEGRCQRARGHNAGLAWYAATFHTRGHHMGDALRLTVLASDGASQARVQVSRQLLCMHNDGSTPQT